MASNRYTEEELKVHFERRANMLIEMIQKKCPASIMTKQVALIVDVARLIYGVEAVDSEIAEMWRETQISEAGLCTFCKKSPVHPNYGSACQICAENNVKENAIEDFSMGLDDPGKEKH